MERLGILQNQHFRSNQCKFVPASAIAQTLHCLDVRIVRNICGEDFCYTREIMGVTIDEAQQHSLELFRLDERGGALGSVETVGRSGFRLLNRLSTWHHQLRLRIRQTKFYT